MRTATETMMRVAVGCALAVAVAACAGGNDGRDAIVRSTVPAPPPIAADTPPGEGDGGEMEMEEPEVEEPIEPMGDAADIDDEPVAESADTVMIAAAIDVQAFWEDTYPEVYGEPFPEIEGGFWSYGPDTPSADLPPCDIAAYGDIAANAFYCPSADLVAWDREALVGPFIDEFGAFSAAIIMAHELGHAVQARSGDFGTLSPVLSEQQADCFSGAWVAHVAEGGSDVFQAEAEELDVALAGLIEIRDAPGSDPDDPAAHGSGFDRISAFSAGFSEGAQRCATFDEDPPVITEDIFDDPSDATSGGDLAPDELVELVVPDLEAYYTGLFASEGAEWAPVEGPVFFDPSTDEVSCGDTGLSPEEARFAIFYCVSDNTVYVDAAGLLPALAEIGDFALGAELARQWAFAAQVQTGNDDDEQTFLHADCLTGLYAGDLFFQLRGGDAELSLSPGDLDEAIISFLAFAQEDDDDASPFERTDAFRTGFLGDVADCDALLDG